VERAEAALDAGEQNLKEGRYREAVEAFRGGEAIIDGVPLQHSLRQRLRDARKVADRGRVMADLHSLCEQVRPLYAVEGMPTGQVRAVAAQCRTLWNERESIARELSGNSNHDARWKMDLLDLGILTAHLETLSAPADHIGTARLRALDTLAQAEELLGPNCVLYRERARLATALNLRSEAEEADRRYRAMSPRTAWEHLAIGRSALGEGDAKRALAALDRSLELQPDTIWANYYRGLASLRLDRPIESVAAFSACVALLPDSAWCFHNRGLAYAMAGRPEQAMADVNRALSLDPQFAAAYLQRASLYRQAGRTAEAAADLEQARKLGAIP
jgi:tetratricopeptide (TPR) repeat protein